MTGIDQEKMDVLVEKSKIYIENINDNSNELCLLLTEFNNDYRGNSLDDVFFKIVAAVQSLKKADDIFNCYVHFLESVKKNYILQDINFGQQISRKN